ncbi:hypothetical protein TNCT_288131 [Trichonephila clavata]|uniref:Uncharacterized protein n=1 Tax=Trichonephila clavata TaxID=2740835 RepID=A0A8X6JAX5_TRICU|nr:hypothetical protein TNCT_288131 [Trichonephila clavata]
MDPYRTLELCHQHPSAAFVEELHLGSVLTPVSRAEKRKNKLYLPKVASSTSAILLKDKLKDFNALSVITLGFQSREEKE